MFAVKKNNFFLAPNLVFPSCQKETPTDRRSSDALEREQEREVISNEHRSTKLAEIILHPSSNLPLNASQRAWRKGRAYVRYTSLFLVKQMFVEDRRPRFTVF